MARQKTGSLRLEVMADGSRRWRGRFTLANGKRVSMLAPEQFKTEARAREWLASVVEREGAHGEMLRTVEATTPGGEGESVEAWFERYFKWRRSRGFVTAKDTEARLRRYALPHLAGKTMRAVTRDDIEAIVRALDARVEGARDAEDTRFSWKTAINAWGDVTRAFDEAVNSKDRSLRVLDVDPTANVRGPDRGDDRESPFLYPTEIVALLACERVPLYRRHAYAVAAYTGARSNELAALSAAEDVDFEHMKIHVTKQLDRKTRQARPTKTRRVRSIDIEPALVPLLRVLVAEAGEGRLLRMPPDEDRAALLRKDLQTAGCKRPALFADDEMRAPMKFHGLRNTCLSHMAVRGDDFMRIQWRAGHTQLAMTQRYIDAARKVAGGFGTPFPPLPDALVRPGELVGESVEKTKAAETFSVFPPPYSATPTGIEPVLPT